MIVFGIGLFAGNKYDVHRGSDIGFGNRILQFTQKNRSRSPTFSGRATEMVRLLGLLFSFKITQVAIYLSMH